MRIGSDPARRRSETDAPSRPRPAKLTNIQALRAFAATSVVLSHSGRMLWTQRDEAAFHVAFNDHLGTFGVVIFFAVSGFLMSRLARSTDAGTFLVHRIVRIYPAFLLVAALWLPLRPLFGGSGRPDWLALSLAPVGLRDYPLGVEWTLVYETSFYVLVYLVAASGQVGKLEALAVAWLALLAAAALSGAPLVAAEPFPRLHAVFLKDANVAFAAGLLLPRFVDRVPRPDWLLGLGILLALLVVGGEGQPLRWLMVPPALLILVGLLRVPQLDERSLLGGAVVRVGDWSYVLYLVHMPVLVATFASAPSGLPGSGLFCVAVATSLLAAAAIGPLDVGLYRWSRRKVDDVRGAVRTRAAAAFAIVYVALAAAALVPRGAWTGWMR